LSVVLLAIILDRITESFGRAPGTVKAPLFSGLRSAMRSRSGAQQPAAQS
jgi:glycine betaine/proline transport system permease protein